MDSSFFHKYGKALVSLVVAVGLTFWQAFSGDHRLDLGEKIVIILAFANAAATYIVPLVPEYKWAKSAASALIAAATVATTLTVDGFNGDDLGIIMVAALQALGVKYASAVSNNGVEASAGLSDR